MPLTAALSPPAFSLLPQPHPPHQLHLHLPHNLTPFLKPKRLSAPQLAAARRSPNYPPGGDGLVDDPRNWSLTIKSEIDRPYGFDDDEEDDDDEDEDDEEDRSLDLLVGFSVNGVLMLAFLWVLRAFLEVICTLGSLVFVSILLIRGVWIGVAYAQENRNHKMGNFEDESRPWTGTQPAN